MTADHSFTLLANSVVLGSGHDWKRTKRFLTSPSAILRVKAKDNGGNDGILLSTSEGLVSNSSWKCVEANPGADLPAVSKWPSAIEHGKNGMFPWGRRKGISEEASWIWAKPGAGEESPDSIVCTNEK